MITHTRKEVAVSDKMTKVLTHTSSSGDKFFFNYEFIRGIRVLEAPRHTFYGYQLILEGGLNFSDNYKIHFDELQDAKTFFNKIVEIREGKQ